MGARKRIAILISGRGSNMEALIDAARAPEFPAEIALVASNNPEARGLQTARAAGIGAVAVDHRRWGRDREGFERALSAEIEASGAEILCLAGFMRLLTPWFVTRWGAQALNIHPALLPAFRGLNTHARALETGVAFHGATVHLVGVEMDDGPIIGQAALRVAPEDDADTLGARVLRLEHRLYPACLRAFLSGWRPGDPPLAVDAIAEPITLAGVGRVSAAPPRPR